MTLWCTYEVIEVCLAMVVQHCSITGGGREGKESGGAVMYPKLVPALHYGKIIIMRVPHGTRVCNTIPMRTHRCPQTMYVSYRCLCLYDGVGMEVVGIITLKNLTVSDQVS